MARKNKKDLMVKIDPKNDIYWVVNPTIETIENKPIIKLTWGFDWNGNQILMTKDMATMLRDDLSEILNKL